MMSIAGFKVELYIIDKILGGWVLTSVRIHNKYINPFGAKVNQIIRYILRVCEKWKRVDSRTQLQWN